jgi:hypothetical protein
MTSKQKYVVSTQGWNITVNACRASTAVSRALRNRRGEKALWRNVLKVGESIYIDVKRVE